MIRRDRPGGPPGGVRAGLSVVLGTYNRFEFLRAALESVRAQESPVPRETIVVDGGSSDGTLPWLTEQKDVLLVLQHNRGEFRGRALPRRSWGYFMNLGFKLAQGEWVLMISDDCLLLPGAIANALRRAEELRSGGARLGGLAFYYRDWPAEADYYVQRTLGGKLLVNHGLFSRAALEEVGWADEERYVFYKADGDLCLRIWHAGYEIADCPGSYVEHHAAANPEVRSSNEAVLRRDREAYLDRWRGIYYHPDRPDPRGRVHRSHRDPERTAERLWSDRSDG